MRSPFKTLSILSVFQSLFIISCFAVQDTGDDGWDGLARIDVNPKPPIDYGAASTITVGGATITEVPRSWTDPNTDDLSVTTVVVTSGGAPVTTTITNHAELVTSTTTANGQAAAATNLVLSPKLAQILDQADDALIKFCSVKVRRSRIRRQACDASKIGVDQLTAAYRAAISKGRDPAGHTSTWSHRWG